MLTDTDLTGIQSLTEDIKEPVTLYINLPPDEGQFGAELRTIAAQISGVSMNKILLETWNSPVRPEKPSLAVAVDGMPSIHYFAFPEGKELAPFLDLLMTLGKSYRLEPLNIPELDQPITVTILIAEACPHCPSVVRSALSIAAGNPKITLQVIDALRFSDIADHYKVKSTPTIVINEGYTCVGQISAGDLAAAIQKCISGENGTQILDSMIKTGRAEEAGVFLCESNNPGAVIPLFTAKEFSARMGALVAIEEALAINPRIMDTTVPLLLPLLDDDDVPLRGDTAELLGKIGHPSAIPALKKIAESDPDEDVREAASEALESINEDLI